MKIFVSKDIRENQSIVTLLIGIMILMAMYVIGNFWLLSDSFGLTSKSVIANVLGDEGSFTEPMELLGMVETLHSALFIGSISIMIVLSVLLRLSRYERINVWIIAMIFISFVCLHSALFLIRFVSDECTLIYLSAFWLYHGLMMMVTLWNTYQLIKGKRA